MGFRHDFFVQKSFRLKIIFWSLRWILSWYSFCILAFSHQNFIYIFLTYGMCLTAQDIDMFVICFLSRYWWHMFQFSFQILMTYVWLFFQDIDDIWLTFLSRYWWHVWIFFQIIDDIYLLFFLDIDNIY